MHLGENGATVVRVMGTSSASRPTEINTVIHNQMFQLHSMQVQLGSFRSLTQDPCAAKQRDDTQIGGVLFTPSQSEIKSPLPTAVLVRGGL
jgi:hypothetical protein